MSKSIFTLAWKSNWTGAKDGTAQGVAKQRLIETLSKSDERIINDPYADRFVIGASIIKLMGHKLNVWLAQKFAPGFHEHLVSRTRFIDDLIKKSAASGVEQYVILGAGYDSRAHRLELPSSLRIFEVDQPEVQTRKRSKLPKDCLLYTSDAADEEDQGSPAVYPDALLRDACSFGRRFIVTRNKTNLKEEPNK